MNPSLNGKKNIKYTLIITLKERFEAPHNIDEKMPKKKYNI